MQIRISVAELLWRMPQIRIPELHNSLLIVGSVNKAPVKGVPSLNPRPLWYLVERVPLRVGWGQTLPSNSRTVAVVRRGRRQSKAPDEYF